MTYSVRFSKSADREPMRLDRQNRAQIMSWIKKKLLESEDPRRFGHALAADLSGYWSYRSETTGLSARMLLQFMMQVFI